MTDKLRRFNKSSVMNFLNNTSCFRFVFMMSLFFMLYPVQLVSMVWAGYLFYKKMIKEGYIKKIRYRKVVYLFLAGGLVTVLLHAEQNLLNNLFILYWLAVCFFFFYGLHGEKSHSHNKREMMFMLDSIVIFTTIMMVVGLVLLAFFPKGFTLWGLSFCIYENRFVGIITNANALGFYAIMAAVACHMLWKIKKADNKLNAKSKTLYIVAVVINMLSLFLSDSNASLLFVITYICFLAFYKIFRDFKKFKVLSFILRFIATTLACTVIATLMLGVRTTVQSGVSLMLTAGESKTQISNSVTTNNDGSVHIKDDVETQTPTTFEHENTNIDSGRFVIWKQSLGLFEKFPLMGIGKANIVSYGEQYLGGLKYDDFHNGLITIIISFGLVGFNIFMVLAITVAKAMLKAIFICKDKCRRDGDVLVLIVAFCAAYCVYSMFEIALLMDLSYRVFIFWAIIGFGLSYVFKYEREKRRETVREKLFTFAALPKYESIRNNASVVFNDTLNRKRETSSADSRSRLL